MAAAQASCGRHLEEHLDLTTGSPASRLVRDEIETFVIIHDQQLLLEYEQQRKFPEIRRLRYVFVGSGAVSLVSERDDVIVARLLPDNIEQYPNLLSFTGWYAIARNKLITMDYVAVLEHDAFVSTKFERETVLALRGTHSIVGYLALGLAHPLFLHAGDWLVRSLAETYDIDVIGLVRGHLKRGGVDQWTTTTNHAMRADDLAAFVDWFLPLTPLFRHDPAGSYVHERAIPVYCLLNHIEDRYVPGVLEHAQVASHGIGGPSYEEVRRRADGIEPLISPVTLYERMVEAERALAAQSVRVGEAERALAAQSVRVEEAERALAAQSVRVEEAERALAAQSARVEEAEQLSSLLLNSTSWRLTRPMRRVGRILRRLRTLRPTM
jgi:hypothetical protein